MRIAGIETSCDETAIGIYDTQVGLRSNIILSQIPLHAPYGGVVPEAASRAHIEAIAPVMTRALGEAGLTLADLDGIAVTTTPGLPGSLLVGIGFAKALAYARNLRLLGVNHLEGHIFSPWVLGEKPRFPYLCLTASGGHTALYLVTDYGMYTELGSTLDDAAGEAFDKIAKLFGYDYPGGPVIERLATEVDFTDIMRYPRLKRADYSFSFSGLKTAIVYDLIKRRVYDQATKRMQSSDATLARHVASSLLVAVGDQFCDRVERAIREHQPAQLAFVGGVACNAYLRRRLAAIGERHGILLAVPAPALCTDNGAMIAYVGHYRMERGESSELTLDLG